MKDIYELISFLDEKKSLIDNDTDECGDYLEYQLIGDDTIIIDFGWNSYEEGDSTSFNITFGDIITVVSDSGGHSVMGGDFEENVTLTFTSTEDFTKWIEKDSSI